MTEWPVFVERLSRHPIILGGLEVLQANTWLELSRGFGLAHHFLTRLWVTHFTGWAVLGDKLAKTGKINFIARFEFCRDDVQDTIHSIPCCCLCAVHVVGQFCDEFFLIHREDSFDGCPATTCPRRMGKHYANLPESHENGRIYSGFSAFLGLKPSLSRPWLSFSGRFRENRL